MGRMVVFAVSMMAMSSSVALAGPKTPTYAKQVIKKMVGTVDESFQTVSCRDSAKRLILSSGKTVLDPKCTYSGGFEIQGSEVVLDCRGARVVAPRKSDQKGLMISANADQSLSGITVRNCIIQGFTNNLRITRKGFKDLAAGREYDANYSNVLIENSKFYDAQNTGVFIDGFVAGVTLKNIEVAGSGSVGVYLEAGSIGTVVSGSHIHHNGYEEVGTEFHQDIFGDVLGAKYKMTGREGLAIDGSRENQIVDNVIESNAAGAVFLYKNCGEFKDSKGWWIRRYGADNNRIEGNRISREQNGVWIASRQSQNQFFMECSDRTTQEGIFVARHEDFSRNNTVRGNVFKAVRYGVRVEDDGSLIERNEFFSGGPISVAVVVGTKGRQAPIRGTVLRDNQAKAAVSATKKNVGQYQWFGRLDDTTFVGNSVNGQPITFLKGKAPKMDPFLFIKSYEISLF